MEEEKTELRAIFRGRVQGVGFRWTIQAHAEKRKIHGIVTNLANGTVEMIAQGSKKNLSELLQAIKSEPGSAQIVSVESEYRKAEQAYSSFQIQF